MRFLAGVMVGMLLGASLVLWLLPAPLIADEDPLCDGWDDEDEEAPIVFH
jgi:hypothetical protein